jgi:hypothetical protein
MIKALEKSLGVVTTACREVGIARKTHYEWYNEDAEYKKAVDDLLDVALDFAESMLHKQIQEKDTTATIFFLKCKGKKRGYIERVDITSGDKALNSTINVFVDNSETAETLKRLRENGGTANQRVPENG